MTKINQPLTLEQVRALCGEDHRIKVVVPFDLYDLIDHDLEGFNDLAESRILECGILCDITYKVVGHTPPTDDGSGDVLIEVQAEVDLSCWEDEEE